MCLQGLTVSGQEHSFSIMFHLEGMSFTFFFFNASMSLLSITPARRPAAAAGFFVKTAFMAFSVVFERGGKLKYT